MKKQVKLITFSLIITTLLDPLFSQIQLGADIVGEAVSDNSGQSVSLSSDGNRVTIGTPLDSGSGNNAGHAQVYEFEPVSSIKLEKKTIIDIFPNPAFGKIELSGAEFAAVNIADNLGKVILKTEKPGSEIDVSNLAPGIYFIQINSGNQRITKKLIKN